MIRRKLPLALGLAGCAALTRAPAPRLIWNTTASAPIGVYRVLADGALSRGDLVALQPPPPLAKALAERGVLPRGVPLLKPVAALPGDTICRFGQVVGVAGQPVATARSRDRRGQALPVWRGCRRLAPGEPFLLNPARDDSFDGRYFGPLPTAGLIGRVAPLWTAPIAPPAPGQPT